MSKLNLALKAFLALLMADSIMELAFISSMVSWLHRRAGGDFEIKGDNPLQHTDSFSLHGKPLYLLLNQGHTSNGAAGTAFVLMGLGGILALWLRSRSNFNTSGLSKSIYRFWLVMTVPATLLTLAALIYVFVVTGANENHIDIVLAARLNNKPYPRMVPYPYDSWTPQNWFSAMLELNFVHQNDRSDVAYHLRIMRAWQYNTIPMFVIQLATCSLALVQYKRARSYASISQSEKVSGEQGLEDI